MAEEYKYLGKTGGEFDPTWGLDTFPTPPQVSRVSLISDEVTAVCPMTGQPDWYTVEVIYHPRQRCIESKSWKFYLQSFRNRGLFVEALANEIAEYVYSEIDPRAVFVNIRQKPRGGVEIQATATKYRPAEADSVKFEIHSESQVWEGGE